MTRSFLILLILFLQATFAFAQFVDTAWVRRYNGPGNGDDWVKAITLDSSGNVYITGVSYAGNTDDDYCTIKYDSSGNELWVSRYNGPGNYWDWACDIALDTSGNVYVTGKSFGIGTEYDYATIKYDSAGNELWVRRYNGPGNDNDEAVAIGLDCLGNVYVTGIIWTDETGLDFTTIKYYPNGDTAWIRRYNGPENEWDKVNAMVVDALGNAYVTGFNNNHYVTVRYDSSGNLIWVRGYAGPGSSWDEASAIALDGSGNVYITGASSGIGTNQDYATIKYDSSGNEIWVARYNGPEDHWDLAWAITVDCYSNVYVTGQSHGISWDYVTVKYDSSGNEIWVNRFNGPQNGADVANAITVDSFGNVYVTGQSCISHGWYRDYVTIKYDSSGHEIWIRYYDGPGSDWDEANAIAIDDSGNIYVTGQSVGEYSEYDFATIKYTQIFALRGDVNGDDPLTVTDVIYLIDYLFRGGPAPIPILMVGDVNYDDSVDIADVVYLANYFFKGGPPPLSITL